MSGDDSEVKSKSGTQSLSKAPLARLSGGGSSEDRVVECMVRVESGASIMLSRTNYQECALVMQVKLQVARVWSAVDSNTADENDNTRALQIILIGIPPEMLHVLAAKDTTKMAW
ncbi:lectin receptor kinase [Hordeum vulgare]|nr:lectin receptor kinase [Hordeum vulgare]